jgi:hypothetical protein
LPWLPGLAISRHLLHVFQLATVQTSNSVPNALEKKEIFLEKKMKAKNRK